ncbi:hypothetical protein LXL04_011945 [Taraxacum kok-saghyz]
MISSKQQKLGELDEEYGSVYSTTDGCNEESSALGSKESVIHATYTLPYGNIQSNNITHTSLKTKSKQTSTNDSALPRSVYCLGITAFRLHVSALLPSDYWLGIAAFGPHITPQ